MQSLLLVRDHIYDRPESRYLALPVETPSLIPVIKHLSLLPSRTCREASQSITASSIEVKPLRSSKLNKINHLNDINLNADIYLNWK